MRSFFLTTEYESKRDHYHTLYRSLKEALADHDKHAGKADSSYRSYIHSVPNLSNSKIPSNDFDMKREELNNKLLRHFENDKDKRSALAQAKEKAYDKYLHYKELAAKEREAELAAIKKAFDDLIAGLEGKNGEG